MKSSSQNPLQFSHQRAASTLILTLAVCLLLPTDALASTSSLPWDGPIQKIANGLQGPVAFLFALGGMIVLGVRWIFGGELGTMTRALLTTVAGIALLVFAAGFLAQLFGVASVISATPV
jgi:type IV secretion system protein VirB2